MTQIASNANSPSSTVATNDLRGFAPSDVDPTFLGLPQIAWIKIAIVSALMAGLFRFNLLRLWDKTNPFYGETNWGHAIAVPLISLYYLYVNREELLKPQVQRLSLQVRSIWTIAMVESMFVMNLLWVWVFAPEWLNQSMLVVLALGAGAGAMIWLGRGTSRGAKYKNAMAARIQTNVQAAPPLNATSPDNVSPQDREPTSFEALVEKIADTSASWFGGFIMLFGIALFGYGIYPGQNDFVKDFGMLVTLMGIMIMLIGWARMRIAWFAVSFLVCAIPWPGLVYSRVAGPLQQLAARVAVWTLEITGVESSASGTKILMAGHNGITRTLNVAEACAGLRSLMTFISVGAAVAFLSSRPLWQKLVVTLSAIPIAIFCNVMRVAGQGLLDHYVSQQLSENFAHQFVGMIMLIPAFVLILLVGWVLDQIFLEVVDRHKKVSPTIIRQNTQNATAPVAAVSGRSLASSKAPRTQATPAPAAPKRAGVVPPPPSARLASGTSGTSPRNAPPPAPAVKPPAAKLPSVQPRTVKTGKAI